MNPKQLWSRRRPHLWFQLYWVVYLIWFFWLDLTIKDPKYIIHAPLDDRIPFNEWFIFPYCSWFVLLAGVTALLWWCDTQSYDKLCLTMFSGMTFCLILYMLLPNGLDIPPHSGCGGPQQHCNEHHAADLEGGRLGQCVPVHPLPKLGLHGTGVQPQQAGKGAPGPENSGLGVGCTDLCVHRVHQAALHH